LDFYEDCKIVSQYYIPGRYPTHWPILTKKQAEEAYKIAKNIIDYIETILEN
jgi:HEPN domain-containing protein